MNTDISLFGYIIIFSLLGGVFSLIIAALLLVSKTSADRLAYYATPFAAGALLSAVFLDLLREGVETANPNDVFYAALVGILFFFFAERFLRWFHHHHQHPHQGHGKNHTHTVSDPRVPLIIAGDTMHNALDGVAIAASFLVSVPTGIITTIAVAAHEIPQEIGDFGLLLKKGVSRRKVLLINFFSAMATVVAAAITYMIGSSEKLPLGILLGISAGFLLYIAMSDIIPSLHEDDEQHSKKKLFDWQPVLLLFGVVLVAISIQIAHQYIDAGHDDHENTETEQHVD